MSEDMEQLKRRIPLLEYLQRYNWRPSRAGRQQDRFAECVFGLPLEIPIRDVDEIARCSVRKSRLHQCLASEQMHVGMNGDDQHGSADDQPGLDLVSGLAGGDPQLELSHSHESQAPLHGTGGGA